MQHWHGLRPRLIAVLIGLALATAARTEPADDLVLRLSVPHTNNFYLQPTGEARARANTGFLGFGVGVLVRHSSSQSIGLAASVATDLPAPFPAPIDFVGEHEIMTTRAIDLTNNHRWRRWSFGYGPSYSVNQWELKNLDDPELVSPERSHVTRRSHNLGLVFPVYYALNERFALGLVYRPGLYRFGGEAGFRYEHVVSIDIAWNISL